MYDVLIVGAGPAGSVAAKTLAERGRRVLLVEKFPLPRNKSCSGVLIQKSMDFISEHFGEPVPESVLCTPFDNRGMVFTSCTGQEYRFPQPGQNLWRSGFDYWLAGKARESGAVLLDRTMASALDGTSEGVSILLRGERVVAETARYVLICEGAAGSLRKKRLGQDVPRVMTFQTFNRGEIALDPHYFYAYLQPELSDYDAWFNVKDSLLVLGVSSPEPGRIPGCYQRFISYLQQHHRLRIAETLRSERWVMPLARPGCPLALGAGRVFFAGEAAGFLNPMGEGISSAMESGYHAACALDGQFACPEDALQEYRERVEPLHGYMRRQWSFVGGLAESFCAMRLS